MKTILRIHHMEILLPDGANVTQLLKVLSKSKLAENNFAVSEAKEKWTVRPIRELRVVVVADAKVVAEKVNG